MLVLDQADRLQAAGDERVHLAGHHALSCERDRLQAGGAEAVDRHSGRRDGKPGAQRDLARDVRARGALAERAADDDVLHLAGVEPGPLHRGGDGVGAERRAVRRVE